MRWIIGSSLRFRFLVVAAAAALMVYGAGQLAGRAHGRLPGVRAAARRGPDHLRSACRRRRPRSSSPSRWSRRSTAWPGSTRSARRRCRSCRRRADLQARDGPHRGAPGRAGAPRHGHADAADLGGAAGDAPADLDDEPRHAHRRLRRQSMSLTKLSTIAYWKIRARLLRVPGVVNVAIWGERLQEQHVDVDPARLQAHDVSLDEVMNATADSLDAGLLRYTDFGNVDRHRRLRRHAPTSGSAIRPRAADQDAAPTWRRSRSSSAQRQARPARRRRQRRRGPPAARRRRRHQRRARACCSSSRRPPARTR